MKAVGRPTHDSQKREDAVEKVTNVFMEQYTLPTDTNEIPNLPTSDDVKTWWLSNQEETYEAHYGLRDPMIDVLRRSYLWRTS